MSPFVAAVTKFLSLLTIGGGILTITIWISQPIRRFFGKNALLVSFIISAGSILGSLFYSEIAGFAPCVLCWWQRIFIYPQAVIFLVALLKKDTRGLLYGFWLSISGILFSIYNTYLQFGGSPLGDCSAGGVSCSVRYFLEFGYVTIPTMALTAFALLITLFFASRSLDSETK